MSLENASTELIGSLVVEHASSRLLDVIELPTFADDARRLLTEEQLDELCSELATLRQLGSVIKETNGLRKFRWAAKGKGKRGGVRVIYFYGGDHMPIFMIAIYSKSEKSDMTSPEKKAARKFIETLKKQYQAKRTQPQLRIVRHSRKGRR